MRTPPRNWRTMLHGVQSDAATGHLGDLLAHAEAGQEEKRQEFLLAQLRRGLGGGELAIEHGLAQALQIDAAAVVAQFQDQHAGVVAGADGDPALGRLPAARRVSGASIP